MIRKTIAFISTILIPVMIYGQLERIDTTNGVTREIYNIDKNGLKQGEYIFQYNNRDQVKGTYVDNLKNGKWIYQPDKDFQLVRYYKSDEKDSVWNCFLNNVKYSTQNYITGESRSYYSNGRLRAQGDSINGVYHYIEYSKRGKIVEQVKSDSIYTDRKEFDKKGNIIEHIIFKNGIPYEIIKTSKQDRPTVYSGDISKGNGKLQTKIMSYKTGELYVDESIVLKDSKPNGKYEKLNEEGKVLVSGKYQNGYMVDDWTIYDSKTLELDTVLHYSIHDSIENDKNNKLGFMTGKVNIIVEDMPEFNGESFNEFRNFIASNLKYPEEAADMSIQGTVFVQFAIDLNGKVVDAKITKGVDPLLDNEALRVVNLSPYWRPGMQKGVPIKVQFTFPISFTLN